MKKLDEKVFNMSERGFLLRLLVVIALIDLFIISLAAWTINQQYDMHHEQAEVGTSNLALALESELHGQILAKEMALYAVQDEFHRQRSAGRVDAQGLNNYIEQVRARLSGIDAIRITDSQGILVYGTDVKPVAKVSLADRPHFLRLRDDAQAGLVISKPQISRANNKMVIVLARRLTMKDGSFGGMVFAAIPLDYLTRTFTNLDVGENGVVALRDEELAMVARYPESPLKGLSIGSKTAAPELHRLVEAGQTFSTYRTDKLADNVERTISFRKLADYPLYIVVGRASMDYLADARAEAKKMIVLVSIFVLVSLVLAGMAYLAWRRQSALNQSLFESETRLNELFENMSSGVAIYRPSEDGQDFMFIGFNRAAERMESLQRTDLMGKNVVEVFPGIGELGLLDVFRRVCKSGVAERFPMSFYHDGRIAGWRDNFIYKLPSGEIVSIYDDVTERMQAHQELEQLNRDFVTLLESTSDFIYFKDKGSRIRFCSQSMAEITGHKSWREMVGKHDLEIFPAETAKIYYEEELPIFRDGVPIRNRIDPYYDGNGKQGWVSTNKWPVFDSDGKTVIGIFGISRDVSEYTRAEIALRQSEEMWKFALEGAGDGVWDWSVQTGDALFSKKWKEMIGYAEHEFANRAELWVEHIHPEDKDRVLKTVQDYFDGKVSTYAVEFRMRCKDGSWKWMLARGMVVSRDVDGKPLRMVGTHADITQRKKLEESLVDSEARLRTIIQHEPECIKIVDERGMLTQMNPAGLAMIEADSLEQVAGRPVLGVIAPEYRAAFTEMHKRVLAGETMEMKFEVLGLKGGRRMLETHAVPMQLHGKVVHLAVTRDISERQKAEDALRRSNSDLERFAYSVSHDMRQPLRAVSGHLQLLQRSLKDKLDEDDRENLGFALQGAKRMDSMIVSLLEYSRVGRKTEPLKEMPSRESLDEALDFLEPLIKQTGAGVSVGGDWPQVFASRDELTRLFQNLIGNALHYHEQNQPPLIEVQSGVTNKLWRVSVRDHGIGIDPQQVDRLFQFFSRLQARSRFDGTGMGLALCRRIAEHHNGRIWVESEGEGKGSTFIFEIPLGDSAPK